MLVMFLLLLQKIYTMFLVYIVKTIDWDKEFLHIFRPVMATVILLFTGECH